MCRVATLVLALALCAPLSACGTSSPSSAKAGRASIVAAALAQKSVHWTAINVVAMISAYKTTTDVTTNSGVQTIAYFDNRTSNYDTLVHLRLVNHTVYIRGSAESLLQTLNDQQDGPVNLTNAQARRYAGQWISIPQGDKLYAQTAEGMTLASIVHSVVPIVAHRRWKLKRRRAGPNSLVGPSGMSVAVRSRGEPLLVEFDQAWVHRRRGQRPLQQMERAGERPGACALDANRDRPPQLTAVSACLAFR